LGRGNPSGELLSDNYWSVSERRRRRRHDEWEYLVDLN
jgi:hypothetical protein